MSIERPDDVRLVCLDWGGVLLRICRSWEEACIASGLPLPEAPVAETVRRARRALSESYQCGRLSCEAYFASVADLSPGYSAADIERLHDAYLIAEYDGAIELAQELAGHDRFASGLLSNTNHRHWLRRSEFTAAAMLEHQLASHLQGMAKPDEGFYRALESASGCLGAQIAFFDDLPANVQAARSLGWQAVLIDHDGDTIAQVRSALAGVL
ncbi:MAG: HAD family hydrolase [Phycisphaerales bacterium]